MDTIMNYNTSSGSQLMPEAWLERTGAEVKIIVTLILILTAVDLKRERKKPSQMDVAPWCYKQTGWDGQNIGWGEV